MLEPLTTSPTSGLPCVHIYLTIVVCGGENSNELAPNSVIASGAKQSINPNCSAVLKICGSPRALRVLAMTELGLILPQTQPYRDSFQAQ
jgi:hypothetical protein